VGRPARGETEGAGPPCRAIVAGRIGHGQLVVDGPEPDAVGHTPVEPMLPVLDLELSGRQKKQKRYLKLREDEFDAARLRWLDPSQWAVWHSAYLRPQWRPPRWCSIRSLTSVALWCETATA
jgi:hypothetical protein